MFPKRPRGLCNDNVDVAVFAVQLLGVKENCEVVTATKRFL